MSLSVTKAPSVAAPSNIVSVLRCLSNASAFIPIPGIAPAVAIVSAIMEIVESIRTAKSDCKALAEKAAQLVLTLHKEAAALDGDSPVYKRIQSNIGPFQRALEEIQTFIIKLSRRSKIKLVWKRDSILEKIAELSNSLDTCYQTFQITSFVHLHTAISQFSDEQTLSAQRIHQRLTGVRRATLKAQEQGVIQLSAEIRAIEQNITSAWRSDISATTKLLEQVSVDVKNSAVKHTNTMVTTFCEIEPVQVHIPMTRQHGGVTAARYRNKDVLVKRFQNPKDFLDELSVWKDIWHPHLPRLVAFSSEEEKRPFVVLDGQVVSNDTRSYILKSLKEGTVAGLMAGLQIIHGISTALDYLRNVDLLSKAELAQCLQPSGIVLSNNNGVMLGGNLLTCTSIRPSKPDCHRDETMEEYLADKLFTLMRQIFCPESRFASLDVKSSRPISCVLRILLQFGSFGAKGRTLTQIRHKIETAWTVLSSKRVEDAQLSLYHMRECFLQIEDMVHSRAYIPPPHWNISTGDIGYVMDNNFVLIANVFNEGVPGFFAAHEEILSVRCDPCRPYNVTVLPDGWKRYEFDAPAFVSLWHTHCFVIDEGFAMRYLRQHASSLLEKAGLSDSLRPRDMVMVVNRESRPRHSGVFNFTPIESSQEQPPANVYFFESYETLEGGQWGYWSLKADWEHVPAGSWSNIKDSRVKATCMGTQSSNMFEFIQLEDEDIVMTPQTQICS